MRWWLAAAIFWTLLIMAACWLTLPNFSGGGSGEEGMRIPHLDKIIHASLFAVFGVLWMRVIPGKGRFLVVVLAGVAFAGVTELAQNLPIIARDGEWADGFADVAGLLLSYPLAGLVARLAPAEEPMIVATAG